MRACRALFLRLIALAAVALYLAASPHLLASAANVAGSSGASIPAGWPGGIAQSCSGGFWSQHKLTLWQQVVDIVGVSKELCNPAARYLAFAPTNAALTAFMATMGFERGISDLQQRPGLAREILAMHLVLALPPDAQQQLANGGLAEVPTEAQGLHSRLKVKVTAGGVLVTDGQGDSAHVLKVLELQENKTVVILDRVLFSGHYYTSFARLCNHRPMVSDMCAALFKAGVLHSLATTDFSNTVFVPGNQAFVSAGIKLSALTDSSSSSSSARVALVDRIRYHVVPGLHPIPGGFKNGAEQATLLSGKQLQVVYKPASNGTVEASVVADGGRQRVPVVVTGVYVGQAIAHGITGVLQPPATASASTPSSLPLSARAAAVAVPGLPQAASSSSSTKRTAWSGTGRRLAGYPDMSRVFMPMNKAETDIRAKVHRMTKEQEEKWGSS